MRSASSKRGPIPPPTRLLALSVLLVVFACTAGESVSEDSLASPESTTTTEDRTSRGDETSSTLAPNVDQEATRPVSDIGPVACSAPVTGIPQTGVALPVPDGFYVATNFTGIFNDATKASVVAIELPGLVSEEVGINEFLSRLEIEQGMNVAERRSGEIAGFPATFVRGSQMAQGAQVDRWILISEGDDSTLMLTAQVPALEPAGELDALLEVLRCAVWTPGDVHEFADGPPFTIEPVAPFDKVQWLGLAMLLDGGDGSLFVVAPLLVPALGDPDTVARDAFWSLGPGGGGELDSAPVVTAGPQPISIDGLDGIRLDGEATVDGEPFTIMQIVLLADGGGGWRMVALLPRDRAGVLLPVAEEIARSFHTD